MFRPSGVFRNASAVISCGGKELFRRKAMIFTPGEMASYTLKADSFAGLDGSEPLTVRIEKGAE